MTVPRLSSQLITVPLSAASVSCAVGVVGASYAGCDGATAMALLTAGVGGMGGAYPGMRVNALDLSRHHAGTVMALVNGVGAVSGIVSPLLIGLLTPTVSPLAGITTLHSSYFI